MTTPRLETRRAKLSPSGMERRIADRIKSYAEAWADPGGMGSAMICKIIDISYTGAKLVFHPDVKVPDRFTLQTGHSKRVANVVWRRSHNQIGVEFELRRRSDMSPDAPDAGPPAGAAERRKKSSKPALKS